jgi:hypothetical protein
MQLQKLPDGSLRFSGLNSWDVKTFRSLPALADYAADPAAEKRLLPSPAVEGDLTPEMAMDWVEYVVPELRESFARNLEIVLSDLQELSPEPEGPPPDIGVMPDPDAPESNILRESSPMVPHFTLNIPADHIEPWFRAMNQARLVLSARYGMDSEHPPDLAALLEAGQLEHWFQYELFVSLQGWLVEVVMDPD